MYFDFGFILGEYLCMMDDEFNKLSVVILLLFGGEFYYYGISCEFIFFILVV